MDWAEEMVCFPVSQEVILGLYQLACTPFTREHFEDTCASLNWKPVEEWKEVRDEPGWSIRRIRIAIDDQLQLQIFLVNTTIRGATLPFCFNADFAPREAYDAVFQQVQDAMIQQFGAPLRQGVDRYGHPTSVYQYSIWLGTTGLLVVGQDDFDYSTGGAVSYWLLPSRAADQLPDDEFYVWLEDRLREPSTA